MGVFRIALLLLSASTSLVQGQVAPFPNNTVLGTGISTTCQSVLQQSVACSESLLWAGSHGRYEEAATLSTLCTTACNTALSTYLRRVIGATVPTAEPGLCEDGTTYTIKPTNTCHTIAKSQKISVSNLLTSNGLQGFCSNFPTTGTICIPPDRACTLYTVRENDTCSSIADANGATFAQVVSWAPELGRACSAIGRYVGYEICVSNPGGDWTDPMPVPTQTETGHMTPAPVPTDVNPGTNPRCGIYYDVSASDDCAFILVDSKISLMVSNCAWFYPATSSTTCQMIMDRYGLTLAALVSMNTGLNADCSGLWANVYVCIGRIGTPSPTVKPIVTATTTASAGNGVATPTPTQVGMVTNCAWFHPVTNTTTCDSIVSWYKNQVTLANLIKWNPAIGSGCNNLWANTYACIGLIGSPKPVGGA